jgi:hypothetical protein
MDATGLRRAAGFTRRAAILTGSAGLVVAAKSPGPPLVTPPGPPPDWQTPFGLTAEQHQASVAAFTAQGYRLVHLTACDLAGSPIFAAIWSHDPGPAWIAHHDLTADAYQPTQDQMAQQGYRLSRLCGYAVAGEARYAAIWTQGTGPPLEARCGLSMDQYHRAFGELTAQGYRLTWVSGYAVAGAPLFAAIFELDGGPDFMARHGLDAAGYQAALNEAAAQGYRLRHVCGYAVGDVPYFAAIWEYGQGPAWDARYNLTADQFGQANRTMDAQGLRPMDVSGYGVGKTPIYAAIWINA